MNSAQLIRRFAQVSNSIGRRHLAYVGRHRVMSRPSLRSLSGSPQPSLKNPAAHTDHAGDHAFITADIARNMEKPLPAHIEELRDITPTVKLMKLRVESSGSFTFECGQWVDLFLPDVDIVGGFSILSKPSDLPHIYLAVKHAYHPPAYWIHHNASEGETVSLRIGGEFCYNIRQDSYRHNRHLLLATGGIGFTPLHSILADWYEWFTTSTEGAISNSCLTLLYSAKTPHELLFADELKEMQEKIGKDRLRLHFTHTSRSAGEQIADKQLSDLFDAHVVHCGRINDELLKRSITSPQTGSRDDTIAFLCGPPAMTDHINSTLLSIKALPQERILYEKWW